MDNGKDCAGGGKATGESPNPNPNAPAAQRPSSRTPFTSLSQVDADLALARALQEQERAYMMLRWNGGEGSDYASSDAGSYVDGDGADDGSDADYAVGDDHEGTEEDAFDAMEPELDPADFESDEAFARAMHEAEGGELAARLMAFAGLSGWRAEDHGDQGGDDQDAWEDVDPDELSYEELVALGEVVGTESRGLSADTIASLLSVSYKAQSVQDGNTDQCVICRLDYEDGESLIVLQCKHTYHPECINRWLQINKVCPVCSAEVSTSQNKEN